MILTATSVFCLAAYLAVYAKYGNKEGAKPRGLMPAIFITRFFIFAVLFFVPITNHLRLSLESMDWAHRTESAAILAAAAVFMLGFSMLSQRLLAIRFKMAPAFDIPEIIFVMILPAMLFAGFALTFYVELYLLGPAFYSAFLIIIIFKNRRRP